VGSDTLDGEIFGVWEAEMSALRPGIYGQNRARFYTKLIPGIKLRRSDTVFPPVRVPSH
jgi:hypothetical protein